MLTFHAVLYSERDNFEADLKELKRRFETLDLTHTAVTRERNAHSKEVLHTPIPPLNNWSSYVSLVPFLRVLCSVKIYLCPPGGDVAAVSDAPAEGQGVSAQTEHGAQCPLCSRRRSPGEAAGSHSPSARRLMEYSRYSIKGQSLMCCHFFFILPRCN